MRAQPSVAGLLRAWDGVQVELLGRYTPARMQNMLHASRQVTATSVTLIMVAIPLLSLAPVLLLDIFPLHDPAEGVYHQTVWFWLRVAVSVGMITFCITQQIKESSPKLHLSTPRVASFSVLLGLCAIPSFFTFGVVVGFPTPFALQLTAIPWSWMLGGVWWAMWRGVMTSDPEAKHDFTRYLSVFACQFMIVFLYPIYYYVFTLLNSNGQAVASVGFAVLRLVFRFWSHKGVYHVEDLAPVTIIFNVDVFHALYVSSTMQQATSSGTIVTTVAIDIAQGVIGYLQIHQLLSQAAALTASLPNASGELYREPIAYALRILTEDDRVRENPSVVLPRHLRPRYQLPKVLPGLGPDAAATPSESDADRVQLVISVLQLLHLTEFLVLVEFVEVIVAGLYSVYLLAMSALPNRVYYVQMATLTPAELRTKAASVGIYALAEFVSFVVFGLVIDRRIRSFSTFRQLGFVLRKHWQIAQTMTTLWVLYVVQLSLEHAGSDYSLQFKWLHHNTTTTSAGG